MEREYYKVPDVAKITGFGTTKASELINKLNKLLKEEYPNNFIIEHKIPIWFWNKKTGEGTKDEQTKAEIAN